MAVFEDFEREIRDSNFENFDLSLVFVELKSVVEDFENSHFRYQFHNSKSYLFTLEKVATHPQITYEKLEILLNYLHKVKELFFDKFFWNRALGRIYKRMMEVNGWKREVMTFKKFKVVVETGLVILTNMENSEIQDLSDEALNNIPNLIFLDVGGDGRMPVEHELINLPKPILSVKDYKKEIISQSEFKGFVATKELIIFDGTELSPKNIIKIEAGEYLVCAYEFENKVKLVMSKVV